MRRARAFTLVELLVAAAIVTAAMIPLVAMFSQQNIQAHFTEQHMLARYRARRMADTYASLEYQTVLGLAARSGDGATAPDGVPADARSLPSLLPPMAAALSDVTGLQELPAHLRHLTDKLDLQHEAAFLTGPEPGLARLDVVVTWKLPTDPPNRKPHTLVYSRILTRAEASAFDRRPCDRNE